MIELISLLDSYGLDDQGFWTALCETSDCVFEIHWKRDNFVKPWRLVNKTTKESWNCNKTDLVSLLELNEVDTTQFAEQLHKSLLGQTVYAIRFLSKAREILGSEAVDEEYQNYEQFSSRLLEIMSETFASMAAEAKTSEGRINQTKIEFDSLKNKSRLTLIKK